MRKFKTEFCLPILTLFLLLPFPAIIFLKVEAVPEYIQNFGNFSDQLVHVLEVSEPTEHRPGIHMYTPFSIGYLMANIYERLWPVPVQEVPEAIFTLRKYVATDYAALLRLFKKRQFRVSSTIYSRFGNVTKPQTFPQLLTQVISLDLQKNRTEFRQSLREILERGTKGHLENEMLPKKEPAWREIFDNTTHGVYVNTLHYKAEWDNPWRVIGEKKFFDNTVVPFMELQGKFPFAENENASAVIINLQASTKQIVLFKPHDYATVTDMRRLARMMLNNESLWHMENVTIQIPVLNMTNLAQPSEKFPFLGVMETFCRGRYMDPSHFYYNQHPIAHANHFEFSPHFIEMSSASGSLVSYQNNKDFLPKPPANQSVHHESSSASDVDYFDILEASEEEDQQFLDYIVDARSELPFQKRFRGEFRPSIYKRRNHRNNMKNMGPELSFSPNFDDCEVVTESSTESGNEQRSGEMSDDMAATTEIPSDSPIENLMQEDIMATSRPQTMKNQNMSFILDSPFSWVMRDKEIGEVFYGSVSSLCLYNRAVRHIPTVPAWVLDLFKAFYWRCV